MHFPIVQIVTEFFGGRFEDKIVNSNALIAHQVYAF